MDAAVECIVVILWKTAKKEVVEAASWRVWKRQMLGRSFPQRCGECDLKLTEVAGMSKGL
jgi:hypothetical protein